MLKNTDSYSGALPIPSFGWLLRRENFNFRFHFFEDVNLASVALVAPAYHSK
jgi:hypothetical protein